MRYGVEVEKVHLRTGSEAYALLESGQVSVPKAFNFCKILSFAGRHRVGSQGDRLHRLATDHLWASPTLKEVLLKRNSLNGLRDNKTLLKEMQAFIHIQ